MRKTVPVLARLTEALGLPRQFFCSVYMRKNCPGKPGSRLFNAEISFCRDSFFSYKRNFIFGEVCVSDEIPAPRASVSRARTGTVFLI